MTGKQGQKWNHRLTKGTTIHTIDRKTRELQILRNAQNTILENGAYHSKNIEEQDAKLSKLGNLSNIETKVIEMIRTMRHDGSIELANMVIEYNNSIDNLKGNTEKKKEEKKTVNEKKVKELKEKINAINKL